jgi:hypothetical protein
MVPDVDVDVGGSGFLGGGAGDGECELLADGCAVERPGVPSDAGNQSGPLPIHGVSVLALGC